MRTVAFCENEPFARAVLAKNWPGVPVHDDVRSLCGDRVGEVEVVCGGFPCQDISLAGGGKRGGIDGERSGLWREMRRIIGECRPRWVIVENVPALRTRGADRVLGELEGIGYACWPLVVGAVHAGAPHRRQRVWIVAAHAERLQLREQSGRGGGKGREGEAQPFCHGEAWDVCHADEPVLEERGAGSHADELPATQRADWWAAEPELGRVAHGVPRRVDRLRCLGNAVVPQVVEAIGRSIMRIEHEGR